MRVLGELSPLRGSRHKMKRLGRGKGSGHGGTSTKGHKGQKARSGHKPLRGFEGGQMPLVRRLPKFGFTNAKFKTTYDIVNLSDLNRFDSEVCPATLNQAGLVRKRSLVKILGKGQGELKKALNVKAHRFSKSALEAIKKAGGQATVLSPVAQPSEKSAASGKTSASDKASVSDETSSLDKTGSSNKTVGSKEAKKSQSDQ